jgi:hypothetical protein
VGAGVAGPTQLNIADVPDGLEWESEMRAALGRRWSELLRNPPADGLELTRHG